MFHEYASDFGRDHEYEPANVIKPTLIAEIQEALANPLNTKIAIRGMAHCTGGQSLVKDGLVIDMKSYAEIGEITQSDTGEHLIEVQAGALWKSVFNHCLQHGLMPPTFADWLELTVGGTLSTGGVGQCSFKKGLQIDNVVSVEVLTVTGEILRCSSKQNKELFDMVRGGMGQFGIITRAWIRLEKAPESVYVYKLHFSDLSAFLSAQTKLTEYQTIDAIQSHVVQGQKQSQYYELEVTKYADSLISLAEFKLLLAALTNLDESLILAQENKFIQHVNRVPPLLANPLETNYPKHHHCCFFISANKATQLLSDIFANPDHCEAMGCGTILIIPIKRSLTHAPYFMLPSEENIFFVGILRRHLEPCQFDELVKLNEATYRSVDKLGGKVYPVGSGSFLTEPEFWRKHYGDKYKDVVKAKVTYDPDNRLAPNIRICNHVEFKKVSI